MHRTTAKQEITRYGSRSRLTPTTDIVTIKNEGPYGRAQTAVHQQHVLVSSTKPDEDKIKTIQKRQVEINRMQGEISQLENLRDSLSPNRKIMVSQSFNSPIKSTINTSSRVNLIPKDEQRVIVSQVHSPIKSSITSSRISLVPSDE